jgi:hypothetical protein
MTLVLKILMSRSYNIRINDTEITEYQFNFSGIGSTEWRISKYINFKNKRNRLISAF